MEKDAATNEDVVADLDIARALGTREFDATAPEADAVDPPQVARLMKLGSGAVDVATVVAIEPPAMIVERAHLWEVRGVVPRKPDVESPDPVGCAAHARPILELKTIELLM